jgi:hypothetical protein
MFSCSSKSCLTVQVPRTLRLGIGGNPQRYSKYHHDNEYKRNYMQLVLAGTANNPSHGTIPREKEHYSKEEGRTGLGHR